MSFFDEYSEGEGLSEATAAADSLHTINFSGKDGSYSWKDEDATHEAATLQKVIVFWNLDGRVLWPGSGPIPADGSAPLCRTEKDSLPIAAMRPSIGPATLATMAAKGYTGNCATCALGKFDGDQKPLCKQSATLYVVDPGSPISDKSIHRMVFNGPSVIKTLKTKIEGLLRFSKEKGKPYAAFVVSFGKEKVAGKKKGDSYCIPTLSVAPEATQDPEWIARLGVEARLAMEATRVRPSWAKDPQAVLNSGAVAAALQSAREADGIQMEDIPF